MKRMRERLIQVNPICSILDLVLRVTDETISYSECVVSMSKDSISVNLCGCCGGAVALIVSAFTQLQR